MNYYRICLFGSLSNEKFLAKILPLISTEMIDRVYLFRYKGNCFQGPVSNKLRFSTIQPVLPKKIFFLYSLLSIFLRCIPRNANLIISVYFYPYGLLSGFIGLVTGVPVIHLLTGSDLRIILRSRLMLWVLSKGKIISVRGTISKRTLIEAGIDSHKIFIHQNIFKKKVVEINRTLIYDLIFVGSLTQVKRLDIFIEIIARLREKIHGLKAIIVGDGPEFSSIKKKIQNNGLSDNIETAGFQHDVYKYLRQSKILLLTSESEGMPMVLVEAMSCGLPVMAPAINDIPDIIRHGENGFMTEPENIDGYCNYIITLLEDRELYQSMSDKALAFIGNYTRKTSLECISNEWTEVLSYLEQ